MAGGSGKRNDMTDSKTPGRKTLGIKTSTSSSDAPRKPTRPVRVSDLNRKRVQEVVTGIKQARERAGERDKRKAAAPAEGAARAERSERPARPARPRPEGDRAPRRYGDDERRPPQRRVGDDERRPPQRGFSNDERAPRPRRFGDDESRPPRRYGDDERRPPQRGFSNDERRPPQRGVGNDERTPRPRRVGDDESRPPRRYGDDERRPPQRRAAGDDTRRPAAPARRFSDSADRARPPRTERPAPRAEVRQPVRAPQEAQTTHDDGLVRLSKRMSELGLCSRREADEWIPRGWVLVDGKAVTELGSRIRPDAEIEILQAARSEQGERVTVLINKPVGYVSGQAEDGYEPAAVLFAPENQWSEDPTRKRFAPWQRKNLAPAGRLDIDSTGLLVLTQDGRVARALIGDDSNVEKEYLVRVVWESPEGPVERNISAVFPAEELERLRHGLSLDGVALRPAKVSWQNEEQMRFVLREGRKRQIRRMCEQVGLRVVGLKRVRMGRVVLGDLPPGQWRFLGPFEKF